MCGGGSRYSETQSIHSTALKPISSHLISSRSTVTCYLIHQIPFSNRKKNRCHNKNDLEYNLVLWDGLPPSHVSCWLLRFWGLERWQDEKTRDQKKAAGSESEEVGMRSRPEKQKSEKNHETYWKISGLLGQGVSWMICEALRCLRFRGMSDSRWGTQRDQLARHVPGSKLPLFPYNRGWSSTQ